MANEEYYKRQIERLNAKIRELEGKIAVDDLTKILSRRGLEDALKIFTNEVDYQLKNPDRRQLLSIKSLSVLFIDIDHFKQVNDTYGHKGGDVVLQQLAATVRNSLRGIDVVGRYGGEEIVVGLIGAEVQHAQQIAEDLRTKIATHTIELDDAKVQVTVSIGVASMKPGLALHDLLDNADKALYQAKNSGRNRVEVYA